MPWPIVINIVDMANRRTLGSFREGSTIVYLNSRNNTSLILEIVSSHQDAVDNQVIRFRR
jgi:hypothetical protein